MNADRPARDLNVFILEVPVRYARITLLSVLICAASLALSGCNSYLLNSSAGAGSAHGTNAFSVSVNSVVPAVNATCVSATTAITIPFNEALDAATLTANNLAVSGPGGAVAVKINANPTSGQVVLTPASPLSPGTITVTVNNVRDAAGQMLSSPYMWTFSTSCGGGDAVAYVYVTGRNAYSGSDQIVAYAADTNGQLTPVPGSPFNQDVGSIAATNAYLVAGTNSGSDINTYTIGSGGALTLGPQFDYSQVDSQIGSQIASQSGSQSSVTCGMGVDTFDRTGQSLYTEVLCSDGANNYDRIASFAFDSSNGTLSYLGNADTGITFNFPTLSFLGNNQYAYQVYPTGCSTFTGGGIFSFARGSNGLLNAFPTVASRPPTPPGATAGAGPFGYEPGPLATDSSNHVAIVEDACFFLGGANQPVQLAAYTANPDGSLTTSDTYATMPSTPIDPNVLAMSPSGTLLAVGGGGGVQIFHFNGSSSITSFSGVLTTDFINWIAWDNSNHLYALQYPSISSTSPTGNLHVFTVTASGVTEAPGSPYSIPDPLDLAVSSQGGN